MRNIYQKEEIFLFVWLLKWKDGALLRTRYAFLSFSQFGFGFGFGFDHLKAHTIKALFLYLNYKIYTFEIHLFCDPSGLVLLH